MEEEERESLRDNYEQLVEKVDACALLPHLFQEKVIDMSQMETIRRNPTKRRQAESLYDCVTQSPLQEAFSKLMESLEKHENHKDLVKPIQKSLVARKKFSRTYSLPSSAGKVPRNVKDLASPPTSSTTDYIPREADKGGKNPLTSSKSLPECSDTPRPHCMLHAYLTQAMIEQCTLGIEVTKFKGSQNPFYIIMEIVDASAADEEGTLLDGDELIQVNGEDATSMTQEKLNESLNKYIEIDAIQYLKITIKRPAFSNTNEIVILLQRENAKVPFGFRFTSGISQPRFPRDTSNYVSKVEKMSVACKAGVKYRDTILKIDGRNVQQIEFQSLRQILKSGSNNIKMLVSRESYQ